MNCNRCNSLHVKPYTYATYVTQLQLCMKNYCAILMQLVWNFNGNVVLILFFIHQSNSETWHCGFLGEIYILF